MRKYNKTIILIILFFMTCCVNIYKKIDSPHSYKKGKNKNIIKK